MTSPNELPSSQAIEEDGFELAAEIASPPASGELATQAAIIDAALFWGLDYGSLPNQQP